jgi:hypothetical protein
MDHHPGCTTGKNEVSGEHDMNHSHIPANIPVQFVSRHRFGALETLTLLAVIVLVIALPGCGGGASTETLPVTNSAISNSYTGPAPATADVQAFKLNVWDNLKATNRCGGCHIAGDQTPMFVRQDDVNLAYAAANTVVNLSSPADSRLVTKVAEGHNCWLQSDAACGAVMTAFIEAWAGGSLVGGGKQIELKAPLIKDVGASKSFPGDSNLFASTVHPLLTAHCVGCHTESSATPQSPFFANSDPASAYDAAKSKINLDDPARSRLVIRLRDEFHNCWSGDCQIDANTMEAQILAFSNQIPLTQVDPLLVVSKALQLGDGIVAAGGSRFENNVIALYEFKTGQGSIAYDTSGVEPALNLNLSGNVSWVGGYGIEIVDGKAQGSTAASKKLHDLITSTGEYSIEAWVVPANVTQEDSRIVSYSAGTTARNFTLGQTQYNYDFMHRSSSTDADGQPALSTADADEDLQATLQHVVVTYDPANGRRTYVNGVFTDDLDPVQGGTLAAWDDSFALVLGNEVSGDRLWQGKLRLVAIHNRALALDQIIQNFEAGVGEKFFLLFGVSDLVNVPESYIMFEVSQFDSYSYLFNSPTFISLDPSTQPGTIPIQAMRIGVNGQEAAVGQAYRNLNTAVTDAEYTATGQTLSDLGTIIALEKGPESDEFFLTFEVLGNNVNVVTEPAPLPPGLPPLLPATSDIGLRTFDEINATMSQITGVGATRTGVKTTFDAIKQQLPSVENIEGFLSAHQMAISQLAIEYCNALVEDNALRTDFFGSFAFTAGVASAFGSGDSAEKNEILNTLYDNIVGLQGTASVDLAATPTRAEVKLELIGPAGANPNNLFDRLTAACQPGCDAVRTRSIVKSMCAATLASAAILGQ